VLLHGPRRLGKTSLLKQLPRALGPDAIPVFVDLQEDLGSAEHAGTLLGGLAAEILAAAFHQDRASGLPGPPDATALAAEPYVGFGRWLDSLEEALGSRHVLLCLDEFEKLQEQIVAGRLDERVLDLLRGIAQHRRRVTVVLTGLRDVPELAPAWINRLVSTTSIPVGPLQRHEAVELIRAPVPGFPDVYSEEAVEAILAATACQPFLVQALCAQVVTLLNARRWQPGHPRAGIEEVEAATGPAITGATNYFIELWVENVQRVGLENLVRRLARAGGIAASELDHDDEHLVQGILTLERRGIVTRGEGSISFAAPLFAQYVRTRQTVA